MGWFIVGSWRRRLHRSRATQRSARAVTAATTAVMFFVIGTSYEINRTCAHSRCQKKTDRSGDACPGSFHVESPLEVEKQVVVAIRS